MILFVLKSSQAGDDVLQFLEEGLITPSCSLIVGLHKVNDVLRYISENKTSGKVSNRIYESCPFHIFSVVTVLIKPYNNTVYNHEIRRS